jgi:DNA-binding beta-propeller fold protein YncE
VANSSGTPTDTVQALLDLARSPGQNAAAIFNLIPSVPPFLPALNAAPNDWTLPLNTPNAVATDGADILWVANGVPSGSLSAFTAGGVALTPAMGIGSLNAPAGIAVDGSGNVWTANSGSNSLTEFVGLASPVVTPLAARIQ